jgi:hypothetical protein
MFFLINNVANLSDAGLFFSIISLINVIERPESIISSTIIISLHSIWKIRSFKSFTVPDDIFASP